MKKYICLILCFLIIQLCHAKAQKTILLKGKIISLNNGNQEPVSTATISIKGTDLIFSTKEQGSFRITVPEENIKDSLKISGLGFQTETYAINNLVENPDVVINLRKALYELDDIVVSAKKTVSLYLGSTKKSSYGQFCPFPEIQHAVYFSNDRRNFPDGKIRSLRFFIRECKNGVADAPFRIRIYERSKKKMLPGNEILKDVVIGRAKKNNQWVKINLSQYNIDIPAKGFFVVFEVLPPRYYSGGAQSSGGTTEKGHKIKLVHYPAPALGFEKIKRNIKTNSWIKLYSGGKWEICENYNYMIGADLIYY